MDAPYADPKQFAYLPPIALFFLHRHFANEFRAQKPMQCSDWLIKSITLRLRDLHYNVPPCYSLEQLQ